VAGASVLRCAAAQLGMSIDEAFNWAVGELLAQRALERREGILFNV